MLSRSGLLLLFRPDRTLKKKHYSVRTPFSFTFWFHLWFLELLSVRGLEGGGGRVRLVVAAPVVRARQGPHSIFMFIGQE